MTDFLRDLLAWVGFIAIVWQAAKCIGSYMEHPSSHDIRRRPWTEDERDQQRKWDGIWGRRQ